jgi:hypothetical protein
MWLELVVETMRAHRTLMRRDILKSHGSVKKKMETIIRKQAL